ncbi:very-long-chain (3R)-3-hydroxyacyl-CoA dehydratase hpo-8 [Aethina tumida]|uniref:very-long-chain (3R)-3-hydroxyacyl-CoA dehydratase hpo-8 n=1 Tax=Aethina tumida TaxID=116153 RepID=UPI00096B5B3F|nr:very-long-chain (3R)-3-hydroxyacyl-CoA dehydratase hpo-8 [Aethina tumida]
MAKAKQEKRTHSSGVTNYLIGYNGIQTVGWSYLLYLIILYYIYPTSVSLYETVKWTVIIFQNAAVLEVVHAQMGIVPSNPAVTAFQVASRVMVVCGVLMATQAARDTIGLPLALIAWSITEVIRYGNYTLSLMNCVPYIVKWLRYTTFYPLYPIGVTGELLCIFAASQEVGDNQMWSFKLPNQINMIFNYQYFLWFTMFLYIPLFPQMYMHMINQRKKVLGRVTSKKEN